MEIDFNKLGGLVPVVVQDAATGDVLMLGYMSAEALEATLASGELTFHSRSRRRLWRKGEQSGHRLRLRELRVDCDADALLARVEAIGPGVCHKGYRSCFFRQRQADGTTRAVEPRAFEPAQVYGGGQKS
jgi:phosphoribosyl-AMP cyclohydrolase